MTLKNRVCVITGATGGLGRVVAKHFAQQGASLALFSSSEESLKVLVAELDLAADQVLVSALDLSKEEAANKASDLTLGKFGRVDILLHFIGGWSGGKSVVDFEIDQFKTMLQQHFWSTVYLSKAFVPYLLTNEWGRIVVISSPTVANPKPNSAPYAVAKAAEETLILALSQELKHTGVTANILRVSTIDIQHQRERQPSATNAGWTTPEEIAEAILYLCTDAANVINGARIPLYGSM